MRLQAYLRNDRKAAPGEPRSWRRNVEAIDVGGIQETDPQNAVRPHELPVAQQPGREVDAVAALGAGRRVVGPFEEAHAAMGVPAQRQARAEHGKRVVIESDLGTQDLDAMPSRREPRGARPNRPPGTEGLAFEGLGIVERLSSPSAKTGSGRVFQNAS